ncbi:thioredoxin TrxC [Photobacterium lutimaris]|uniref:Thioredoxin TrxC n=1 Tax=Photobacterium lutimaris TaxID=388278 RepID=A0A2T3J476_9GAMM|nr:thioredoxin TrxC [Photobacterium lutimaris]PSU36101.1 thioredoxin TrxC [Photobacterium lutimaris]TDR79207.1 thioredoxin 2 [Photobacterium lutimaris]
MAAFSVQCSHCRQSASLLPQSLSNTVKCPHCGKHILDGHPVDADSKSLDKLVYSPIPVIVVFWNDNCAPCKAFKPIVAKIAKERAGKLRVVFVNVSKNMGLSSKYRLRGVPTTIAFKKGRQQAVLNSALRKNEFAKWLSESLSI